MPPKMDLHSLPLVCTCCVLLCFYACVLSYFNCVFVPVMMNLWSINPSIHLSISLSIGSLCLVVAIYLPTINLLGVSIFIRRINLVL